MAVKFLADGEGIADLVASNFTALPGRNPEGFIELVEILAGFKRGPTGRLKSYVGASAGRSPSTTTRSSRSH